MSDYISREALINKLRSDPLFDLVERYNVTGVINSIPAADVRPVKRGKWINDHNGKYSSSGGNYFCSACKDPSLRAFGKPAKTNFCPNCGADMRNAED